MVVGGGGGGGVEDGPEEARDRGFARGRWAREANEQVSAALPSGGHVYGRRRRRFRMIMGSRTSGRKAEGSGEERSGSEERRKRRSGESGGSGVEDKTEFGHFILDRSFHAMVQMSWIDELL